VGTDLDRRFVLVVKQDQTVESRTVTLGPIVDGLRVVKKGVKAGELVVVNGLQRVRPGAKVNPSVVTMAGGR
jgi:multidrug efflux system membrane fusion protein